jgi:DNA-binding response OmpR family regulator
MVAERILIVEDEANIASFVRLYLTKEGFTVERAATGEEALQRVKASVPALVLLDLNLPDMDGLEVCRRLRSWSQVPILMLTARDDDVDKIVGLEVGADDYVTKPFNPRELIARVKSILRRAAGAGSPIARGVLTHGDIRIDAGRREVLVGGRPVQLAPKEFDLFWSLLEHQGIVLTRDQLLERVWGYTFAGDTRTVDVHVRQLRRKIGDTCPVVTVWGVGYKVADDVPVP